MRCRGRCSLAAILFLSTLALAADSQDGPKDAVVLIIRHGEKPKAGPYLSPAGEQRAEAYARYFEEFTVDSERLTPNAIFAAQDSSASQRPRLTVEPFAKVAGLQVDTRFPSNHSNKLVAALRATENGKRILICWHHGDIPNLLRALGATPENVLPGGNWPDKVYDWVILLRYDGDGRLIPESARRIKEHLMPRDS
jgi:broad specificity phosphatase PhoE